MKYYNHHFILLKRKYSSLGYQVYLTASLFFQVSPNINIIDPTETFKRNDEYRLISPGHIRGALKILNGEYF